MLNIRRANYGEGDIMKTQVVQSCGMKTSTKAADPEEQSRFQDKHNPDNRVTNLRAHLLNVFNPSR